MGASTSSATDIYNSWRNRLIGVVALVSVAAWVLFEVRYLTAHFNQRYTNEFESTRVKRDLGHDTVQAACLGKPRDYQSEILNCSQAHFWAGMDPHSVAYEYAYFHLLNDDLSICNWIANCHDGICDGFVYRWSEKLLMNMGLLIILGILVAIFCVLLLFYVGRRFVKSRREAASVDEWYKRNPANLARAAALNAFKEAKSSLEMIHDDPSTGLQEALANGQRQLAKIAQVSSDYCQQRSDLSCNEVPVFFSGTGKKIA